MKKNTSKKSVKVEHKYATGGKPVEMSKTK
jgi:hypothetical protein